MLELDRHDVLDLNAYRRVVSDGEPVAVPETLLEHVGRQREALLRHLETGVPAYGITTGLGYLASESVAEDEQPALQRSLLTARASGLGPPLPHDVVRGAMLLRLVGFLSGFTAASPALCRFLVERLNQVWSPVVPSGPFGASGEISPLAHLFQTFIGEGVVEIDGKHVSALDALGRSGAQAYEPQLGEGVALLNGSPFATAWAVRLGDLGDRLLEQATVVAALSVALVDASARPFTSRLGVLGAGEAERAVGRRLLELLGEEAVWDYRAQPPVSFRVIPQVHGVLRQALDDLRATSEQRLRSVTDSPLLLDAQVPSPRACIR